MAVQPTAASGGSDKREVGRLEVIMYDDGTWTWRTRGTVEHRLLESTAIVYHSMLIQHSHEHASQAVDTQSEVVERTRQDG